MNSTHFIYIADVYCPWCYAFAPIIKRIIDEHPDIPVHVYGGSLMSQPADIRELGADDPGLAQFWQEVEQTSGRDLSGALAALNSGKCVRIYSPGADMILTALKNLAPGHELEQLLLLEDMFYAQGQDIFSRSATEQIALRWNLDPALLLKTIESPENKAATEQALDDSVKLMNGINSYPTFFLQRGDKRDAVSRGYVHYETVAQRLKDAMQDLGVNTSDDNYCAWHGACSLRGKKR